ncbi:MAG: hypothetical protein SFU25_03730 [Candidatus Caenarcaniphilales bacterium]|nr:hypothetical protein [Candidatus Caenarcaniphilales bacterium]
MFAKNSLGEQFKLFYAGDDRTDEHAFEEVNKLGGETVRVGDSGERTFATKVVSSYRDLTGYLAERFLG